MYWPETGGVYINNIATAVPDSEVHELFLGQVPAYLPDHRQRALFERLARKSQIKTRYSVLPLEADTHGPGLYDFYKRGAFPCTAARMHRFRYAALPLAMQALQPLQQQEQLTDVTHVIVISCTGFYAPGLDIELVSALGLKPTVERMQIGFMGCYAAFNGLQTAAHIIRAEPRAKVLMVNMEQCTLHFQESHDIEQILAFLIFADGCAVSLLSREARGLRLDGFYNTIKPQAADKITWNVGDAGFDMYLSLEVPKAIGEMLPAEKPHLLPEGLTADACLWAVHPGGRAIIDTVQSALHIPEARLSFSRDVLRDFGNMSSATVVFVLQKILRDPQTIGPGCALAFGPGLTLASLQFSKLPL